MCDRVCVCVCVCVHYTTQHQKIEDYNGNNERIHTAHTLIVGPHHFNDDGGGIINEQLEKYTTVTA